VPPSARWNDRTVAGLAILLLSAGLTGASLLVPGYVRPGWPLTFSALGIGCIVLAGVVAWHGRLAPVLAAVIVIFGDVAIALAAFGLAERRGGQVLGALLILPTIFSAIFMPPRVTGLQVVLATASAWVVVGLATDDVAVHLLRTAILVISLSCPAVFLLIFRRQLDQAVRTARDLATTDPLTGLLNRRGLEERTPALLSRSVRTDVPVGALLIDVDHFKQVNDSRGHSAGDEVLQLVARTVRAHVRPDDLVARLGGEELLVVTVSQAATLSEFAERLRVLVQGQGSVTVSIGAAFAQPASATDPGFLPRLLDAADEFMYRAKQTGRNRVCVRPEAGAVLHP
jgi:diguanylate cyclase (GGDEF)-like protein